MIEDAHRVPRGGMRWGGRCLPLDPIDSEDRPWVPMGAWPIACEDLLPHSPAANALPERLQPRRAPAVEITC